MYFDQKDSTCYMYIDGGWVDVQSTVSNAPGPQGPSGNYGREAEPCRCSYCKTPKAVAHRRCENCGAPE